MAVLLTGGAGYIGSHTCIELLKEEEVIVIDNLCNSSQEALHRVELIAGKKIRFYHNDLLDRHALENIFENEKITYVIHFAGLKAVGESVVKPLDYYWNNITGTLNLLEVMKKFYVKKIIFSSSATVYGVPSTVPIREDFPLSATNPYGRTKLMLEEILTDLYTADTDWSIVLLRYFNPIGAHKSGLIGENPKGIPNNLVPYITQVAVGKMPYVRIFGNDYDTKDGTGIRDYIHVVDLAKGHVKAKLALEERGVHIFNLGTGVGYSVLDMIHAFGKVSNKDIPFQIFGRRPGDIAACYADPIKAWEKLGWKAQYKLVDMCEDSWRWQENNPNGYL
ncbi:MAG: UDP-glucose 4-epimerase GalE [Anaerocolumna sp.]